MRTESVYVIPCCKCGKTIESHEPTVKCPSCGQLIEVRDWAKEAGEREKGGDFR